jgi:hypothetical protein
MIRLNDVDKVILYPGVTDMRLGIWGLMRLVGDPEPGCLYVFCGSGMSMLRMLLVEDDSYTLYSRKLKRRKYLFPASGARMETGAESIEAIIACAALAIRAEAGGDPISQASI